tara:strand:- start:1032 stop:1145 length:114 start_codon:yes stop_codon:yes gene_type:complete
MIYGTKLIKKTKTLINKEDEFRGFYGTPSPCLEAWGS